MLQNMKTIDAKVNRPSDKKGIHTRDRKAYWPIRIKTNIQWYHFLYIIDNTVSIIETDIS